MENGVRVEKEAKCYSSMVEEIDENSLLTHKNINA
jgi:hypothetical protein